MIKKQGKKTEDLSLKHTKPITSYKSVAPGTNYTVWVGW